MPEVTILEASKGKGACDCAPTQMRSSYGGIALLAKASTNRHPLPLPPEARGSKVIAAARPRGWQWHAQRSALSWYVGAWTKKQPPTGRTAWQLWQCQAALGSLCALCRISAMHSFRTITTVAKGLSPFELSYLLQSFWTFQQMSKYDLNT